MQTPDASHAMARGDDDASTLFHPDCTVGPGFSPDLLRPKGVARGLGALRAIPPVGNRTLP
jgi:hypothetical protein